MFASPTDGVVERVYTLFFTKFLQVEEAYCDSIGGSGVVELLEELLLEDGVEEVLELDELLLDGVEELEEELLEPLDELLLDELDELLLEELPEDELEDELEDVLEEVLLDDVLEVLVEDEVELLVEEVVDEDVLDVSLDVTEDSLESEAVLVDGSSLLVVSSLEVDGGSVLYVYGSSPP